MDPQSAAAHNGTNRPGLQRKHPQRRGEPRVSRRNETLDSDSGGIIGQVARRAAICGAVEGCGGLRTARNGQYFGCSPGYGQIAPASCAFAIAKCTATTEPLRLKFRVYG